MTAITARTLGLEEEFLLVDAGTLRPAAPAHRVGAVPCPREDAV
jgi:hypothetical protein